MSITKTRNDETKNKEIKAIVCSLISRIDDSEKREELLVNQTNALNELVLSMEVLDSDLEKLSLMF